MIANSHPHNPSQQQLQRCIGINQGQTQSSDQHEHEPPQMRILTNQQQTNSLYGSSMLPPQAHGAGANPRPSSHMFDLANLQQQQASSSTTTTTNDSNFFDSAYDDATSSANQSDHHQNQHNPNHHHPHNQVADLNRLHMMSNSSHSNNNGKQLATAIQNDMSLYSPSSSTSLLYHVYDQINVPNEQVNQNQQNFKRSNTTTVLNPANLFSNSTMAHQQNPSIASNGPPAFTLNNPTNHVGSKTTIPQQELYSSGAQFHLQQPSFNGSNTSHTLHHHHPHHHLQQQHNNAYGLDNHQLMLDTILRQQHAVAAATKAQQQLGQQTQHYHNRPLSSSGASSMSGHSMPLTYGRQPRQTANLPPLPPMNSSKSQNTLASVLQSNQALNHLDHDGRWPKKLGHHQFHTTSSSSGSSTGKWKRAQQRVRHFAHDYSTILKCSMVLILLAASLMPIVKFTLVNNSPAAVQSSIQPSSNMNINNLAASNLMNPLIYPPTKLLDQPNGQPNSDLDQATGGGSGLPAVTNDMLKSKLLIGEFVILNQNFTHSSAQRSLLAESIVRLMEQVFLATDVRRVYSRMEVTEIRPHKSASGITVTCHIILSDSIAYAAQQFGIALYHSLAESNGKLANQPSFLIDKNSIRFNTVPDKDLAIVPPELIPPTFPRAELGGAPSHLAPPAGFGQRQPIDDLNAGQQHQPEANNQQAAAPLDENAVVWTEWSQWSSCVDKNGVCDPQRLHSRLRKCVAQHTGDKVDAIQCRQRFNMQDQELEVADCSSSCQQQQAAGGELHVMSDAPSVLPAIANVPTVMPETAPAFLLPSPLSRGAKSPSAGGGGGASGKPGDQSDQRHQPNGGDPFTTPQVLVVSSPSSTAVSSTGQPTSASASKGSTGESVATSAAGQPMLLDAQGQPQQQMSCSNCTSDEICLLLITEKVPFCAKIKDRQDESGCGGWCKAHSQLCQPVGQNAFRCIHDSECLQDEWRCHDSLCIPMSKRCDGHSNCFDNSDERDCPAR